MSSGFSIFEIFQLGGWTTYVAFGCGSIGILAGLIALGTAMRGSRGAGLGTAGAALAFGVITFVIGVAGYFLGMSQVEAALAAVEPSLRGELEAAGRHEAMMNIYCGAIGAALPLFLGMIALAAAMRRAPEKLGPRG